MQETLKNISRVSFFFFVTTGFLHLIATLLMIQNVINKADWLIFNVLDLPFLLAGLLYGTSRLSMILGNIFDNEKFVFIVLSLFSTLLFLVALYFNFAIPDAKLG